MEKINDLFLYENLKIYQDSENFNFSLDSILLANFVFIRKNTKKILDIGTGNAPIPLILTQKTKAKIVGVEIQKKSAQLAQKSVKFNNLEGQIEIINKDIKKLEKEMENESFDTILCNPPFFKVYQKTRKNVNQEKAIARHEVSLELEEIFIIAKKILKNDGVIALIHRPERMVDIIEYMKKNNIEPKRIKIIFPKKEKAANMLLIEGRKNGKTGLIIEPPLIIHQNNGAYTKEALDYFRS